MNPLFLKLGRLDTLDPKEKAVLEAALPTVRRVGRGVEFIQEGDRPKESTLLVSGYAGRFNRLPDGGRQITALHVPGDFVDLHSFPLHVMDHGVVALSECSVSGCAHTALQKITEDFPHLTRVLWLSTLIDASIHRRWLVAMGRLPAPAHLAHLLCELSARLSVVGLTSNDGFDLPLTQAELADTLGLSQVHVNRVLQNLRRRSLIEWRSDTVVIHDLEKLQQLAEFEPDYLHQRFEPR